MKTEACLSLFRSRPVALRLPAWYRTVAILLGLLLLHSARATQPADFVFLIPSTTAWTDTGLDIPAGSELSITTSGTVYYGPDSAQVTDANGGDYTGTKFFSDAVLPDTVVVSLIGKIGGTSDVGTGTPVPEGISGNGIGFVGTSYDQIMPVSGRLFLGFNDRLGYFSDNSGSFSVNVTIVPEPSVLALFAAGILLYPGKRWMGS